jgi:hypothetical protein
MTPLLQLPHPPAQAPFVQSSFLLWFADTSSQTYRPWPQANNRQVAL